MAAARSASPSSVRATARRVAPAPSAARAAPTAPWPYPSAFTTTQSSAGATRRARADTLWAMAPASTSARVAGALTRSRPPRASAARPRSPARCRCGLMMPTRSPARTTGRRDTSWSCITVAACSRVSSSRIVCGSAVITSPTLAPNARRMSSSKCFFDDGSSRVAPRNDRTVGKWSWLSCTIRSPVVSIPTTAPVPVDDGRAVEPPVDQGLHGRLDVVLRSEGEHVGVHVRTHGRVAGHSVLRELGKGGGEPVDDVAGHQTAGQG